MQIQLRLYQQCNDKVAVSLVDISAADDEVATTFSDDVFEFDEEIVATKSEELSLKANTMIQ